MLIYLEKKNIENLYFANLSNDLNIFKVFLWAIRVP